MADDDSEAEEPAVVLGDGPDVEGAPLARISARLMWGIERSEIDRREGDTTIRTPDGPRTLGDVLAEVDQTYFGTRQEFEDAVRAVVGDGPVPTPDSDTVEEGEEGEEDAESEGAEDGEEDAESEGVEEDEEDAESEGVEEDEEDAESEGVEEDEEDAE